MKSLCYNIVCSALITNTIYSQVLMVPETNLPFYSDIIKFRDSDEYIGNWDILPINKSTNLELEPIIPNQNLIRKNMLKSINRLRAEYGRRPVKLSKEICDEMNKVSEQNPINYITWTTYGFFTDFNYVRHFENKEEKFCDFLFDIMSVTPELFLELINKDATEMGFYYSQNEKDRTYEFNIFLR